MYKQSKFNYSVENSKGELLLFNSSVGEPSMCKLSNSIYILEYKQGKCISNDAIMSNLIQKGLYIRSDIDENQKLISIINEVINPSDLGLTISLTEKCNFACSYCYESRQLPIIDEKTKHNIIDYVRHNIHNYTGLSVNWFGGEPLLALHAIEDISKEFIRICSFNKRSYFASITTNGYNLTIDVFQKLLEYHIRDFQITLDGTKELHDKQRFTKGGGTTFDRIVTNLKNIKSLNQTNFRIVIRSNLTQDIFSCVNQYIDLISDLCSNDSRFNLSICFASAWSSNISRDTRKNFIYNRDSIIVLYEELIKRNKNIYLASALNPEHGGCAYAKRNRFFIRPNGELHKCSVKFENDANIVGEFRDGSIRLSDNYYEKLIDPKRCRKLNDCFYAPICKGEVCPSARSSAEPLCPESKKHLSYILQIFDNNGRFVKID